MKVIAIIPARGGSKGIPKKNLITILGKPLIYWSIEAAQKSKYITDIVVSSDNDEIFESISVFKEVVKIKRPNNLAEDTSPTEQSYHTLSKSFKKKENLLIF